MTYPPRSFLGNFIIVNYAVAGHAVNVEVAVSLFSTAEVHYLMALLHVPVSCLENVLAQKILVIAGTLLVKHW